MQRVPDRMGTERGLAIDGDDFGGDNAGFCLPQPVDPGHKGDGEEVAIERVHHIVQRVMRRNAAPERQYPAQEPQLFQTLETRFDEVLGPGEGHTQDQKQEFWQWIQNFTKLAGIIKTGEMVQKRQARHRETSSWRGPNGITDQPERESNSDSRDCPDLRQSSLALAICGVSSTADRSIH